MEETGGLEQHVIYGLKRTWQLTKNEVEREGRHVHFSVFACILSTLYSNPIRKSLANMSNVKVVGIMLI